MLATSGELGILSRIPIQTSSECWRGDRGVERCKNIQYHLFNYHKSRSVYEYIYIYTYIYIYMDIYTGIVRLSASSFVGVSIPNLQQKGVG